MARDNRTNNRKMDEVDMGNKRFRCEQCGQMFDSQNDYREHQESHQMNKNLGHKNQVQTSIR